VWNNVILQSSNRLSDIEKKDLPPAKKRAGEPTTLSEGATLSTAAAQQVSVVMNQLQPPLSNPVSTFEGNQQPSQMAQISAAKQGQAVVLPSVLEAGCQVLQASQCARA
jgi:hypothetical protein